SLNRLRESHLDKFNALVADLKKEPPDWKPGTPSFVFSARPMYAKPEFRRGLELLRMGLGAEAERELHAAGMSVPGGKSKVTDSDQIEKLWATALLYDRAGRYDKSHWIARWATLDYKRTWPVGANRARWEIAYPHAWWHIVEPAARAQGYPPELLISFM